MTEEKHDDRWLLAVIFLLVLFMLCNLGKLRPKEPTEKVSSDTTCITIWDTLLIEKPVEVVRYISRHDTIKISDLVVIRDTLTDSVSVQIPIEQAVYSDSTENAAYTAYVSGFHAALDSIRIECANKQTIITNTEREKARRIGIGVQLGVGVSAQGLAAPYVGIGVQYRLW